MKPFEQITRGLFDTWESLAAGWHELWQRAGGALTRFHRGSAEQGEGEAAELLREASPWGLLPAEIADKDGEIEVRIEAPGMDSKDFEIDVVGDDLLVRGEKRIERETDGRRYTLTERAYGRFERRVRLPARVDPESARAEYKRGVLRVQLPKLGEAARKTKIDVAAGD